MKICIESDYFYIYIVHWVGLREFFCLQITWPICSTKYRYMKIPSSNCRMRSHTVAPHTYKMVSDECALLNAVWLRSVPCSWIYTHTVFALSATNCTSPPRHIHFWTYSKYRLKLKMWRPSKPQNQPLTATSTDCVRSQENLLDYIDWRWFQCNAETMIYIPSQRNVKLPEPHNTININRRRPNNGANMSLDGQHFLIWLEFWLLGSMWSEKGNKFIRKLDQLNLPINRFPSLRHFSSQINDFRERCTVGVIFVGKINCTD